MKDLDVWISGDLKPSLHCSRAALKSHKLLNLIKLCFEHLDAFTMLLASIKLLSALCLYIVQLHGVLTFQRILSIIGENAASHDLTYRR